MKLGIVCYPTLGGSGVVAAELGHALAQAGHQVHIIAYEVPFKLQQETQNIWFHQVEINRYDLFQYPDYALPLAVKMANVAKEFSLDIFHVHYAIPHATSAFLARQLLGESSPAIVTTLHGTDITLVGIEPSYFDIVKFSIEKSDRVTAVSKWLAEDTYSSFKIKKNIDVIPNFFIPKKELMGMMPVRSDFVIEGEKLLVHASNFRPVKRTADVVEIFEKVRQKIPCKLLFLGSGPDLQEVFDLVQKKGLASEIFFLGVNREIDCFVASADLFLLPSEQESFGLSALEAMAYGVPVIGTNIGGLPELVEDGKSGFLSGAGDIEKMASDAVRLLADEALYRKFSLYARQAAHERFCVDRVLPQYLRLYESLL